MSISRHPRESPPMPSCDLEEIAMLERAMRSICVVNGLKQTEDLNNQVDLLTQLILTGGVVVVNRLKVLRQSSEDAAALFALLTAAGVTLIDEDALLGLFVRPNTRWAFRRPPHSPGRFRPRKHTTDQEMTKCRTK